tara:strand:- start:3415 stop:3690 length:276 start_codon:yes stop_codon:yes gene_type:complete
VVAMNFIGIGPIEILVILSVAIIILGPEKIIQTIKSVVKIYKEIIGYINNIEKINLDPDDAASIHNDESTYTIDEAKNKSVKSDENKNPNH